VSTRGSGNRPQFLVAVTGTGTDVGKTWVAAAVLQRLRRGGVRVSARKPVQSQAPDAITTDADVLAEATGESPVDVCPAHCRYPIAMAPPIAAARLGRSPIRLREIIEEIAWPPDTEIGLVETVGGVRSPVADDGDSATLVHALSCDHVILVADAALGAINAVRLCASALGVGALTVVLNRFRTDDDVHESNRAWLVERDGLSVATDIEGCVAALHRARCDGPQKRHR
jgi:dethiobiotin synthetase